MSRFLVYGVGEFGQVVRNLIDNLDSITSPHIFEGFIDDYKKPNDFMDGKRYGTYEDIKVSCSKDVYAVAIAVGYRDLKNRWGIYQKVKADGYRVTSLIHPQAIVDKTAKIGEGVIIMAGAIVDYNTEIKDLAVLWNGAAVSHDSIIGQNSFLSPNCTICGGSEIGRDSFIGAGSVISEHVKVPDGSFVKAGNVDGWIAKRSDIAERHI